MTVKLERTNQASGSNWRLAGWGMAAFLLLLPFFATQVTTEVVWGSEDFIVFGVMLAIAGGAIELVARISGDRYFRAGAVVAIAACFLLVWVNLAVGILGEEGNPANLMFAGVIAVAVGGAIIARDRPSAMATAMLAAASVQALAGIVGLAAGLGATGYDGVREVVLGTALFGGLWVLSAWLFGKAATADGQRSA